MGKMTAIIDFSAPELDVYARLTENQLLCREAPENGMFIAESLLVIERALAALDAGTARERLADLLRRKVRTTRAATPYELKNKLIRYGLAQGYDYEAVRDAADALIATTDDSCDTFF